MLGPSLGSFRKLPSQKQASPGTVELQS